MGAQTASTTWQEGPLTEVESSADDPHETSTGNAMRDSLASGAWMHRVIFVGMEEGLKEAGGLEEDLAIR